MKILKGITGILALAFSAALVPCASAQTLEVLTAGSSAQFGPFAVAAYALAKLDDPSGTVHHYTVKSGACPSTGTSAPVSPCYASLRDSRDGTTIANEPGNLWVVWNSAGEVWAYLSVDSTVGVRSFQAAPRATLALASVSSLPVSATSNYTYWADGTDDTALSYTFSGTSTTVYDVLTNSGANTVKLTAANTDIRPEDALFATNRALNTLGYGSVADTRSGHSGQYLIGYPIESHFTTSVAHPVSFSIGGGDPFTGTTPPAFVTIPIGAAPVIFLANKTSGSVTASATNITAANAGFLFSGTAPSGHTACEDDLLGGVSSTSQQLNPILREPLSGTMNTVEYSVFFSSDQENGINNNHVAPPNGNINALQLPCGTSGHRYRSIGTGDEVSAVANTENAIGYSFFSYESTGSTVAANYLELGVEDSGSIVNIDPLAFTGGPSYTGALPSCPVVSGQYTCPKAGGASFINLRNGKYPAWSVYRMISDSTGQTNAKALVAEAQALVNSNIPDFVPFTPVCGPTGGSNDPGLDVYREHFVPSTIETIPNAVTITPNDGSLGATVTCRTVRGTYPALTVGGGTEAGGDVGGTIQGPFTANPPTPYKTESQPH